MALHLGQKNKQGKLERKEDNGFITEKLNKSKNIEKKRSWEPFRIYLLKSTGNPANPHPNWAGCYLAGKS